MAEFCLDCWNKIDHNDLKPADVVLSKDLEPVLIV